MAEAHKCSSCGAELPPNSPLGLCTVCLLPRGLPDAPTQPDADAHKTTVPYILLTEKVGDRIGHYKLLDQIGEGGCGVVYRAEQIEPVRRRVALKVIKPGMDTKEVLARFEAERQALALMDHANIAKVLDAGATDAGRPYFVMELVKGERITDYCDKNNLPTRERLALFTQVCHAIQHAHQKGIIHRDIKPSNILVTLHDGVPVPKVIDFGIAKATTGQRLTDKTLFTALEQFIGTPAYMSPEQAEMSGLDIDTRSDIYALGVLLYELLTGQTPFDKNRLMDAGLDEIRRIIREEDTPRPSTRLSALDAKEQTTVAKHRQSEPPKLVHLVRGDLDWIVMKCLEKDRTRRYETANGLAADINRHLSNEPVIARPPSAAYKFQKAFRRNKVVFAAGAVVVVALVAGIGFSTWQAILATRAKDNAIRAEVEKAEEALMAQQQRNKAQAAEHQAEAQRLRAERGEVETRQLLYAANMNLAQQAWEQNNMLRLRQLLEETEKSPARGFEWDYWQRQTHLAFKTLRGHLQMVYSVAFSPDGQRIVTGSLDRTAKVWETTNSRELVTIERHGAPIWSVAFSPDGQRIATGGWNQTAKVWDAASGRELLALDGHRAGIRSLAFSPNGRWIVTGSMDQTAKVWDAVTGDVLHTLDEHSAPILSVAFSPDSQRIVTGSRDQTAKVWETASGRKLLTLEGHEAQIWSVAFSPDGQRIVTSSSDKTAKVWDAARGGQPLLTLKGHSAAIVSVAFSPDGQRIVTSSSDEMAKVWEAASGQPLLTLKGHSAEIRSVAFSPDGQLIVTGSLDQTVKVWEAASGQDPLTLKEHRGWIKSVAFSPDGRWIVTGSVDQTAKVWEVASGRELLSLRGHSNQVTSVAFSPDRKWIVTGSSDKTAKVWDATSGLERRTLKGHSDEVTSVAFSADSQRIVTGSRDHTARVWEVANGQELRRLTGHSNQVTSVAFSPDRKWIVTGSSDKTAKVWDAASGLEWRTLKRHSDEVTSVAFSPDGQRIVTGSRDHRAKVWDAASGMELVTLVGHSAAVGSAAFSANGQRIVTGSSDKTAKVWDAASGRELLTLKGHSARIGSVAFSPDGQRLVTGSADQTAKVWQAARAEQVAAWQEEERAAKQYLAGLQRERAAQERRQRTARAGDEGAIKRWLILAPIPLATDQTAAEGLDTEQLEGESGLRPRAGERKSIGNGELKWQEVVLEDYVIDFNEILGYETSGSVAYAVSYIRSETEQHGLRMLVGSDDEAKVYLNGKQIHQFPFSRGHLADQDTVPDTTLNAGLNVLVFKVVNETANWQGSIRFADAQGNPVKGIEVTLTP